MDSGREDGKTPGEVQLLAYQQRAPLAGEEDEEEERLPPTPPPPLPPPTNIPPLSPSAPPPRPAEGPPPSDLGVVVTKTPTPHREQDAKFVAECSRPRPVRGTIHLMSSLYAKLLVATSLVLLATEVLPNSVPLFYFHGYLFTYLIGVALFCIFCVYVGVAIHKCSGVDDDPEEPGSEWEPVLRRSPCASPQISVFFRVGAVVFGLGTLVAIGLEIGVLFSLEKPCVDQLNFVQPILLGVFVLLQTHFLSLDSQRSVQHLGWCRHPILMHLTATNVVVWLRLFVWESARSWLLDSHLEYGDRNFPSLRPHSLDAEGRHRVHASSNCIWLEQKQQQDIESLLQLRQCYRNTTVGLIWDEAQPFVTPFIVQYCLVGAAVHYILWQSFGKRSVSAKRSVNRWSRQSAKKHGSKVDCRGSSKGLFLGLLVLAVGIVVLILFFVLTHNKNLKEETLLIMITVHGAVLGVSLLGNLLGICRVGRMCTDPGQRHDLHWLLQNIGVFAVYVHAVCSIVVGFTKLHNHRYLLTLIDGALMIVQAFAQSVLFHRMGQKCCSNKCKHENSRPGRQVVTFLAFTNLVLWITESFTTQNHVSSQLQLQFFGFLPWELISRVMLPLVMFYRFHSSVFLMEMWKKGYNVDK